MYMHFVRAGSGIIVKSACTVTLPKCHERYTVMHMLHVHVCASTLPNFLYMYIFIRTSNVIVLVRGINVFVFLLMKA